MKLGVRADPMLAFNAISATIAMGDRVKALTDPQVVAPVWKRIVDIADKYYQPGKFTTFAAYEWRSSPNFKNLHRNIFFLDSKKVPQVPFTSIPSTNPRDLWHRMDGQREAGNEVLAVARRSVLLVLRDTRGRGEGSSGVEGLSQELICAAGRV